MTDVSLDPNLGDAKLRPEREAIAELRQLWPLDARREARIAERATQLARQIRDGRHEHVGVETFLTEFGLSSAEGMALMCLAEALLRIPDSDTVDALIHDKLSSAAWDAHVGHGESLLVNASIWALVLTGRVLEWQGAPDSALGLLRRAAARVGEPIIRTAFERAMFVLGQQFVMGETIRAALDRAAEAPAGYRHSFDMLGEAAKTAADAERYFQDYEQAITAIGRRISGADPVSSPGISVKLSALHPRYEPAKRERVMRELLPRLRHLALKAKAAGIGLSIDAEEADRLALSLELFATVARDPALAQWDGLGLVVQAYQKRAPLVIDWAAELAAATNRRLMLRLVKGAYWDSEVKWAQERGLPDYPVFTRKVASDLCYDVCADKLLAAGQRVYPQFATHNPRSVATVLELAGDRRDFEFQKLHGMGDVLYAILRERLPEDLAVRVYAPVGKHRDLLPYLVRRLLENGASASFIHQIADPAIPIDTIVAPPAELLLRPEPQPLPRPPEIYPERRNAIGLDLADARVLAEISAAVPEALPRAPGPVKDPSALVARAVAAQRSWGETPVARRAEILEAAAALLEQHHLELVGLCVREGGKTIPDAVSELREAVDYCRYYALQALKLFGPPVRLPGPTGERNTLGWKPRGPFACISPWNFPLAIFLGQATAALAAGNAVIAKPAEQTPVIAARAVALLHQAGVPRDVLQLAVGEGATVGGALVADPRIAGIAFTGSTEVARSIAQSLAARDGPIVPLIAETGGINAMLVDSSALPEQVVTDVLASAFQSAGQRCSALRVLFLQEEAAERVLPMLAGALAELQLGDAADPATDVGPVIDAEAKQGLDLAIAQLRLHGRLIAETPLPPELPDRPFVAPVAVEVPLAQAPQREVFGPLLPVVRYRAEALDQVIAAINATGYGLTLGIHSRIDRFAREIIDRTAVGNVYVNRSMIGAVVGVQPFGGHGLSGTGPKAGGPHYLQRFATEVTISVNTAAIGGDVALVAAKRPVAT